MKDLYGRTIDYLRVSVTDRCNLRCRYCMPQGVELCEHSQMLRYEEVLRICTQAVSLGITKFKVTGGEPLVRRGCVEFLKSLKGLPGVEQVTLTTNGLLLPTMLDSLCSMGLDGVNISLDTLDEARFRQLTGQPYGQDGPKELLQTIRCCALEKKLKTKVNAVLLKETLDEAPRLAAIGKDMPVDVRFIELMPIGQGTQVPGASAHQLLDALAPVFPDLHPVQEQRGNGPAGYYATEQLMGRIGLIDAVSHHFCDSCNRVRITGAGLLKPCLCYGEGTDLKALLRGGCTDRQLLFAMENAIYQKPQEHCFSRRQSITEHKAMSQIGG